MKKDKDKEYIERLEKTFNEKMHNLDDYEDYVHKGSKTVEELCRLGENVFATDSGRKLLKILKQLYVESPVSSASYSERASCVREGQNEMVRLLLKISKYKEKT